MNETIKCQFCAEQIPAGSEKCPSCDSVLLKKCPMCAELVQAEAIKCKHCGAGLAGGPAAGAASPVSIGRSMPSHASVSAIMNIAGGLLVLMSPLLAWRQVQGIGLSVTGMDTLAFLGPLLLILGFALVGLGTAVFLRKAVSHGLYLAVNALSFSIVMGVFILMLVDLSYSSGVALGIGGYMALFGALMVLISGWLFPVAGAYAISKLTYSCFLLVAVSFTIGLIVGYLPSELRGNSPAWLLGVVVGLLIGAASIYHARKNRLTLVLPILATVLHLLMFWAGGLSGAHLQQKARQRFGEDGFRANYTAGQQVATLSQSILGALWAQTARSLSRTRISNIPEARERT